MDLRLARMPGKNRIGIFFDQPNHQADDVPDTEHTNQARSSRSLRVSCSFSGFRLYDTPT